MVFHSFLKGVEALEPGTCVAVLGVPWVVSGRGVGGSTFPTLCHIFSISLGPYRESLLSVLPELENYKSRINQLEVENESLQTSLQYAQAEIEDVKTKANDTEPQQQKINADQERINKELKELQRWHIRLECQSRRGNLKFFGVKEGESESNSDTETALQEFMPRS